MDKNQIFSFERNRYYSGKLLTSTDFQAEQDYMNHKRRFLNRFVLGQGIICGLGVYNLDDFSIMIESGIAIDSLGREIVVENSVVKKLSAIDGFAGLTGDRVTLCLSYKEEGIQPAYVPGRQEAGGEYEFNRIDEGYRLFLLEASNALVSYQRETEFYSAARLYGDGNYTVNFMLPYIASCGQWVKMVMKVVKQDGRKGDFSIDAALQMPAFSTKEGSHELVIHTGSIHLGEGEAYIREYWLLAQPEECESTGIIVKDGKVQVKTGGVSTECESGFHLRAAIQAISPKELVTREIGKISLEMRQLDRTLDFVPLAEFTLVRAEHSYVIDHVQEQGVKRYIPLPSEESLRDEYQSYFGVELPGVAEGISREITESKEEDSQGILTAEPVYASGTCEIPLGVNAKKGLVRYSGEIIHGLGHGDVCVWLGAEYLREDRALAREVRHTVFGNPGLFSKQEAFAAPMVELAADVSNDKGSFVAAVMLLKDSQAFAVNVRWMAIRFPSSDGPDHMELRPEGDIVAETPTVVLEPGASHYFHVLFRRMEPCSLMYRLTEELSGEITREGIYTAPAKEGIYEIYISCMDHPTVGTYAYAVVRR